MAIKDYRLGNYESVDFEINDAGTDPFTIRLNGDFLNYLFSDMALYSDSGRTIALSSADWEVYTDDATYTALEAGDDGSGKTISTEIKILNATYQSGTVYARCNSFGTYASGLAQGVSVTEITATGSITIDPGEKKHVYVIPSSVSTQLTITVVQGTHPCGDAGYTNKIKIINESGYSGYQIITDSSNNFWLEESRKLSYFFNSSGDLAPWSGKALVYSPSSPPFGNILATSLNTGAIDDDVWYLLTGVNGTIGVSFKVYRDSSLSRSDSGDESGGGRVSIIDGSPDYFIPTNFTIHKIWKVYE